MAPPGAYPNFGAPIKPQRNTAAWVFGVLAVVAAVAVGCVGLTLLVQNSGSITTASSGTSTDTSTGSPVPPSPPPTYSPRPTSAAPTTRDPATFDSVDTDRTPFQLTQFFPTASFTSAGQTYQRAGTGFYSACQDMGGSKAKTLMQNNGCGNMAVATYLNADKSVMSGTMVIPLPKASNATAVFNALNGDASLRGDLNVWCPSAGEPGADLCKTPLKSGTYRYMSYLAYHRYAIVAVGMYTDSRSSGDQAVVSDVNKACISQVADVLPKITE